MSLPDLDAILHESSQLAQSGRIPAALALLDRARQTAPHTPRLLFAMANLFRDLGQHAPAEQLYRQVLAQRPTDVAVLNNLANLLQETGKFADARALTSTALNLRDDMPELWVTAGTIDDAEDRLDDAERHYRRALDLAPGHATALNNLASLLSARGQYEDALRLRDQAVRIIGPHPRLRVAQSYDYFRLGHLPEAWHAYEARFDPAPATPAIVQPRSFPQPRWHGQKLDGKLLVWMEQGVGEEILYAGLLAAARASAQADILVECDLRLQSLLARSFPDLAFVARATPADARLNAPDVVAQIPAASLGGLFRAQWTDFIPHQGYLKPDPVQATALRDRYRAACQAQGAQKIVGVSWRSRPYKYGDPKSTDFRDWENLLSRRDLLCVNLQYGDCTTELETARARGWNLLHDPAIDSLKDLDDFAAQIAALDHVVTVSNVTAHMAGALAIPADVLVPGGRAAMHHWFATRSDSPWYPALRLRRQSQPGKWRPLLDEIARDLGVHR